MLRSRGECTAAAGSGGGTGTRDEPQEPIRGEQVLESEGEDENNRGYFASKRYAH